MSQRLGVYKALKKAYKILKETEPQLKKLSPTNQSWVEQKLWQHAIKPNEKGRGLLDEMTKTFLPDDKLPF